MSFYTLRELDRLQKETELVVGVSRVDYENSSRTLKIYLPMTFDSTKDVSTNRKQRRELVKPQDKSWYRKQQELNESGSDFQVANEDNPIRLSAGGMLIQFGDSYALVRKAFPNRPIYLTPATGVSDSVDDILHPPKLSARETFEEVLIRKDDALVIPTVDSDSQFYDSNVITHVKESARKVGLEYHETVSMPVQFPSLGSESNVEVYSEGEPVSKSRMAFMWNPNQASVDFLAVCRIPDKDVELHFGETFPDGKPINNDVVLVTPETISSLANDQKFTAETFHSREGPRKKETLEHTFRLDSLLFKCFSDLGILSKDYKLDMSVDT